MSVMCAKDCRDAAKLGFRNGVEVLADKFGSTITCRDGTLAPFSADYLEYSSSKGDELMLIKRLLLTSDRAAMVAVLNDRMLCEGSQLDLVALARLAKLIRLQNGLHASELASVMQDQCAPVKEKNQMSNVSEEMSYYRTDFGRYKTELCRPFEETGSCKYGLKCQFAHGSRELRTLHRHPKYKTELCRTFHTTGFCPYGPRCHFVHHDGITSPPRPNESLDSAPQRKRALSGLPCRVATPTASSDAASARLASLAQLVARIKINVLSEVGNSPTEI